MKISLTAAAVVCLAALGAMGTLESAKSGSDFGHRSDPEACLNAKDKSADDLIVACWKALNSHMMNRNGVAFALNNLAVAYREKGDWDSALNALNAAIKIQGDTWQALLNRGGVYTRLEKPDLALADFNRAIELNSDQPVCFRMRGEYYLNREKYDLAIADFTRAVLLDPKDAKALFLRASAKERSGDPSGAAADLALAKQIDPDVENGNGISHSKAAVPW